MAESFVPNANTGPQKKLKYEERMRVCIGLAEASFNASDNYYSKKQETDAPRDVNMIVYEKTYKDCMDGVPMSISAKPPANTASKIR